MSTAAISSYLWVALGGALGSVGRFWLSGLVAARMGPAFPWGTLLVNVSGSFVIGLLAALVEPGGRRYLSPAGREFFMYGLCGGYTTFSSFSLQTLELVREGEMGRAGLNLVASVLLCLVAVWLGYLLGLGLNHGKRV
jgi:fluoride exporter